MSERKPIVLVTGTSRGIGRHLAEHYLSAGCRVIGCSRGESDLAAEGYEHHRLDIADETAACALLREVRRGHGGLDVLINNAALASMSHSLMTAASAARDMLEVNVLGTFVLSREAAKLMRTSGGGRIINFTSVAVPLKLEGEAVYAASKAAVESLTQILAREFAPFEVTVNAVGPCPVDTAMTRGVPDAKLQALLERQALPRPATMQDVANVIDFLIQPESRMVTGQTIYLGGP